MTSAAMSAAAGDPSLRRTFARSMAHPTFRPPIAN
jgi:hypothetical protein